MNSKDPFKELADAYLSSPEFPDGGSTVQPIKHRVVLDRDRRTLTSRNIESPQIPPKPDSPPLELQILFPGNLPVWANLWLPSYAQRVAAEQGPVALLRLQYKSCSVQIFGGTLGALDVPEDRCQQISDLARWITDNISRVLIVPRAVDGDEAILETELPIGLMTGADEAAKIEAYRRSKELVESARSAELGVPELGLIIAGTNEDDARIIASRISETAARFLKFKLPLERVIPAMGPLSADAPPDPMGQLRDLEVPSTYDTGRLVAELRRAALDRRTSGAASHSLATEVTSVPDCESAPAPEEILAKLEGDTIELESCEELSGILEPLHSDEVQLPPATPGDLESDSLQEERAAIEARFESPSADVVTPLDPDESSTLVLEDPAERELEQSGTPGYGALISGLTPVDLPCLTDASIELALDDQRRLHLIVDQSSLRGLRAAEAWATRNRRLLDAALEGGLAPFENHGIRFDLVVEDAAAASDLHGTGLFLHLLVETTEFERFTIPLNNEKTALFGG
ncbi:MAG: hypothetical protein CBC49_000570 [Alphaproteobacteria bacterium TMED89]|nr:hypothetical protein [Rhodospirillaceae bacterium]RPH20100.1 MAG: hypothetical protein CBC49_000570 [Alphaproteobacteria bacterium TMED89]